MTQRPLARIALFAGTVLAASVGISGIAQAHTTTQSDPSTETMASHMDAMTSAMLAEMAPPDLLTAGPHGPGHEYGTIGGEHFGTQDKGKKCCACKGKEKAGHHKRGSCCSASRTSRHPSAQDSRTTGCCKNAKKAKSA